MKLFLTSSPCLGYAGDILVENGFLDELKASLPHPINAVMITSAPDDVEMTDRMAWELREMFDRAGMTFDHYEVLDRRTQRHAPRMMREANFVILCGGHVPTQNRFFQELNLRIKFIDFDGVVMSISAGSMNAASIVYSSPELEGESIDPEYQRYMRGLGLTNINILPHFQMLHDSMLDGKMLVDEIVKADSYGHPVYCLEDGSFFIIENGRTELRGNAFRMLDGELKRICRLNERRLLYPNGWLRKLK